MYMRGAQTDWTWALMYSFGVIWLTLTILEPGNDSEAPWLAPVLWVIATCYLAMFGIYFYKFFRIKQARPLCGSLLLWQVMILLIVNCVVSITWPDRGYELSAVPNNIIATITLATAPLLDAVRTTRTESAVSLMTLIAGVIYGLYVSVYAWNDVTVFEGIPHNRSHDGVEEMRGSFTKLEIRRLATLLREREREEAWLSRCLPFCLHVCPQLTLPSFLPLLIVKDMLLHDPHSIDEQYHYMHLR